MSDPRPSLSDRRPAASTAHPPRSSPSVLEVRRAVRKQLALAVADGTRDGSSSPLCVLVACSGGADSLSLADALAHEASRAGVRAGGVSVDHGLQDGSAGRARDVAATLAGMSLDPVEVVHVRVERNGEGTEGAARRARYAALDAVARRHRAVILLGHTLDDQAETVLLGLARGSGARSLAGMAASSGPYRRPLLRLPREVVRDALPEGIRPWEDPQNEDSAYARARVRHRVLPVLEEELGPGVTAALARTGELLRADADALDALAADARSSVIDSASYTLERNETAGGHLPQHGERADDRRAVGECYDVERLAALPLAVRWRVLRSAAITAGSPPTDLTAAHVQAMDTLITDWHGQKGVDLPGAIRACRLRGRLGFDVLT